MADILSASNSMNFDIDLKAFEQHLGEVSLLRQSAVDAPYSSLSLRLLSYRESLSIKRIYSAVHSNPNQEIF